MKRQQLHKTYTITLRPEPEGGFTVRLPALPEIITFGADEAEALAMAKDAIEPSIASRKDLGEEIPDGDGLLVRSVTVKVPA